MSCYHTPIQDDNPITATEADFLVEFNQKESPLLRLPRELRDIIYDYALGGNNIRYSPSVPTFSPRIPPIGNFEVWVPDRWANTFYGPMPMRTLLSLQNSSRQLHAEIGKLIFKINTFDITGQDGWNLLRALPQPVLAEVRTIRLILPRGGPIFSTGFDLRFRLRFRVLWYLWGLRKIEAGYEMPGIGISTQGVWFIQRLIYYGTWKWFETVPCYSQYCRTSTPLESAMSHGGGRRSGT